MVQGDEMEEGLSGGSNGGHEVGDVKVEDVGCHREQEVAVHAGDHLVQTAMKVAFHNHSVCGILAQIRGAGCKIVCRVHERRHQQAVAGTMNCFHHSNRYHDFVEQGIDSCSNQLNSECMTDAGHGIPDCMSGTALADYTGLVQCTAVVAVVDSLLLVDSNDLDAHMCAVQDKHVHVAVP